MNDKWHKRFLSLAREYSTWSKDPSRQIGAVAVDPNKRTVLSYGYNGFPRGILDTDERYANREVKYKYVVHAEMNCIYNASHVGVSLNGAYLYVHGLPVCNECAKGIIQVGISKILFSSQSYAEAPDLWKESWNTTQLLLDEAKIEYEIIDHWHESSEQGLRSS